MTTGCGSTWLASSLSFAAVASASCSLLSAVRDRGGVLRAAVAELAARSRSDRRCARTRRAAAHSSRAAGSYSTFTDSRWPVAARRDLLVARVRDRAAGVARGGRERRRAARRTAAPCTRSSRPRRSRPRARPARAAATGGSGTRRAISSATAPARGSSAAERDRCRATHDRRSGQLRPRHELEREPVVAAALPGRLPGRRRTRGPGARRSARSGTRCAAGSA